MFKQLNNADTESLSVKLRRKRFAIFVDMMNMLKPPIKILDVGGTEKFWETMGFTNQPDIHVTLLNLKAHPTKFENFVSVAGDARKMPQYGEGEFDIVFSNSVIEHVGTLEDQQAMAREVQRVGKAYFIQTPNYYFPIEPHFQFPAFQYLPVSGRVWLATHFKLGWRPKYKDQQEAESEIRQIRLLTEKEFTSMFLTGTLWRENFYGLTKSFVIYKKPAT